MSKLLFFSLFIVNSIFGSEPLSNSDEVIYGKDGRKDIFEILLDEASWVKKSNSVAVQMEPETIRIDDSGNYFLPNMRLIDSTLNVCSDTKFAMQNATGKCSGFLAAPNLLVTAGHCVASEEECTELYWVFDYREDIQTHGVLQKEKVFGCKKVVHMFYDPYETNIPDFAIIELDRPVMDRKPLDFRKVDHLKKNDPLVVIGSPSGLPLKVSFGGKVVDEAPEGNGYFLSDLDTFGGSSGSPVFNFETGLIEGIMVRGGTDYEMDKERNCSRPKVCEKVDVDDEDCYGESVTYISELNLPFYIKNNPVRNIVFSYLDNNEQEFEYFYKWGQSPDEFNYLNEPLYFHALKTKNYLWLEKFINLKNIDLNKKDNEGETLLTLSIKSNNIELFKKLIASKVDVLVGGKDKLKPKRLARKLNRTKMYRVLKKLDPWWKFKKRK